MKETNLLNEFIYNIYTDNFAEAETSLRSVVEEKIKNRMKREMQAKEQKEN